MTLGPESKLAEKPCIEGLIALGCKHLRPADRNGTIQLTIKHLLEGDNATFRDSQNQVLLRNELIDAVQRINGVSVEVAQPIRGCRLCTTTSAGP